MVAYAVSVVLMLLMEMEISPTFPDTTVIMNVYTDLFSTSRNASPKF